MIPLAPSRENLISFIKVWSAIVVVILLAGGCMVIMPGKTHKGSLPPLSPEESEIRDRLRSHVVTLGAKIGERNVLHMKALETAEQYMSEKLREAGLAVRRAPYRASGREVANLEADIEGALRPQEIVVIGAHYDSVPGSPGANDNASGAAALLELARLLRQAKPARTVRLVAFTNEEPPFFMTEQMGSLTYARQAKARGDKVVAMLALETIGFYSDEPKSQLYPSPLSLFYPDTGNFIGFVSDFGSRKLLRRAIRSFRQSTPFPSEGVAAPGVITGIGWSDHWSFWQVGYPAIMVTDTAPFRYPHYHSAADTPDKLDYDRMARVVRGLGSVVQDLAAEAAAK